jgi:DNA-directed RNA polymerase subunit L
MEPLDVALRPEKERRPAISDYAETPLFANPKRFRIRGVVPAVQVRSGERGAARGIVRRTCLLLARRFREVGEIEGRSSELEEGVQATLEIPDETYSVMGALTKRIIESNPEVLNAGYRESQERPLMVLTVLTRADSDPLEIIKKAAEAEADYFEKVANEIPKA